MVSLSDCLAFGPIASGSFEERAAWLDAHIPSWGGWDGIVESAAKFLDEIRRWTGDRLVWIAPRSACEQCGLQFYLKQSGAPIAPMVIADEPIQYQRCAAIPLGLGELDNEQVAELLDNAPRRTWPADRASPDEWRRLRGEASLLRIVENGRLRSVDPDFFDGLLLGRCTDEWQKWARVVGWAMVDAMEQGHHVGDALLLWRLRELVGQGRIVVRGELPGREHGPDNRVTAELKRMA